MDDLLQQLLKPPPEAFLPVLLYLIEVSAVCVVAAAGLFFVTSRRGWKLLPPQRQRDVPWSGWEVVAACFVYLIAIQVVASFLRAGKLPTAEETHAAERLNIWAPVVAFPIQLAGMVGLLRVVSKTQLYQLGWTTHRLWQNVGLGALAWFLLLGPVYVVNHLATTCFTWLTQAAPVRHPLEQLARDQPLGIEWALLIVTAVVVAPVLEETLFRGVLQRWAVTRAYGGDIIMSVTFLIALVQRAGELEKFLAHADWRTQSAALQPAFFVLLMVPAYLWVRYRCGSQAGGAIFATALLFGTIHASWWPAPIALFVLGLGLGWLAYRTQSLVGPTVFHALFNGVACLSLLVSHDEPPAPSNGKPTTAALRNSPSAATCSAVPGSQQPRRR